MRSLRYIVFAAFLFFVNKGITQVVKLPEIPMEYAWNSPEEYRASKDDIEKCLRWLCTTPYGLEVVKRSEVNAYVMTWVAGSPELTVNLDVKYFPFLLENQELLFTMIHGMAYYQLNHPNEKSQEKIYLKGLETICELSNQSEELTKAKYLKPLLKAHKKKELKTFLAELLKSSKSEGSEQNKK